VTLAKWISDACKVQICFEKREEVEKWGNKMKCGNKMKQNDLTLAIASEARDKGSCIVGGGTTEEIAEGHREAKGGRSRALCCRRSRIDGI
jgi:hypothetical protein